MEKEISLNDETMFSLISKGIKIPFYGTFFKKVQHCPTGKVGMMLITKKGKFVFTFPKKRGSLTVDRLRGELEFE